MENIEKILDRYWFLILLAVSIPAVWALLVPGFYGASDDLHIAWLYEFHKSLMMGQIPPRFVPDLSFGFGYPLFNFVFPLPFYIAEVFHILGLSLVDSIKAVFFFSIPLSAIFMFLLLKQFTKNSLLVLVGSVMYIYAPYRAVDLYIRGAVGEIVSFVFIPLLVLSVVKLNSSKSFKWVGIGAVAQASLVLSHNIAAYMFFPFLLLLFIFQFFLSKNKRVLIFRFILTVILGLLTCIYFWLPAILESSLLKYDTVFNYYDHFPTIRQLLTPYWGYGSSVPGPGDGMSFFLGSVNIAVLVLGLVMFIFNFKKINRNRKLLIIWVIFGIASAFFLMNNRSIFVWNKTPLLPYFQFPWRFLILTTFFIPLFIILFDNTLKKKIYSISLLLLVIITSFSYFRPQDFLNRQDVYYLNRYIPYPVASNEYRTLQEEYLRLPKSTQRRPDQNYPLVFPQTEIGAIKIINDLNFSFDVDLTKETEFSVNKYNFPGWEAKVDSTKVLLKNGDPFGQVSINVPKGKHKIEVYFTETPLRKVLDFASLIAFLVSLLIIFI